MDRLPLRLALRNHSAVHHWKDVPSGVRRLFDGSGIGVTQAEFFVAGATGSNSHFLVTYRLGEAFHEEQADIVAFQSSDTVLLIQARSPKRRHHTVTTIPTESVERVRFTDSIQRPERLMNDSKRIPAR